MTQHPGDSPSRPGLPDLSGMRRSSSLPDFAESSQRPGPLDAPGPRGHRRAVVILVAVLSTAVVLVAIVALVLSQTVFSSPDPDDPTAAPPTGEERSDGPDGEYVPDNEDPDIAPPPPVFTQEPTTPCSVPDLQAGSGGRPGTIRGGDLEYTVPAGWDFAWGPSALPYMVETDAMGRQVENGWYSVVNLGRVQYPESEGGYPGAQPAAEAIFQCYATTSGVRTYFGETPTVTEYRTETTTVDGYPAWIVQATYHFEDPDVAETTSASIVTAIVVEGPDGPSALASDVAADHPEHVQGLEDIIASLTVVS